MGEENASTDNEAARVIESINLPPAQQRLVRLEQVRRWMKSPNLEVNGIAFDLLFKHANRVEAPPEEEQEDFFLNHLLRCIRENPQSVYVPSRYMAGHVLRAWFERLWAIGPDKQSRLIQIRDALADLARKGAPEVKDVIIVSILEHLLRNPQLEEFFGGWKREPVLRAIHQEAIELSSLE
jgi:hypothetical protein